MPLVLSPLVSCVFNTGITGCGFEIVGQGSEETKPEPCGHELFSDAGACILQGKRGQGARARNALGIWPTTSQPLSCTCTRLAWAPPWEQRLRLRQRQRRPQRRQPSRRRRKTGARLRLRGAGVCARPRVAAPVACKPLVRVNPFYTRF